jgi:outer membrane protein assembly factor BamB
VWPDGTLRWKLATAEHVASTPALGADGTVYAGSQDDALYAVAPDGTRATCSKPCAT